MVVRRTLEQWGALQLYFNSAVLEDNLDAATHIFNKLNDVCFKLYLTFLSYILPLITKMNQEFQSEKPKLYAVYTRLETISRTILKNFMKSDYIDKKIDNDKVPIFEINEQNAREYKSLKDIYLGYKTAEILHTLDLNDNEVKRKVHELRINCLAYYIELFGQIKKRFQNLETYKCFTCLDPKVALDNGFSIVDLLVKFSHLAAGGDTEQISSEYREICNLDHRIKEKLKPLSMEEFWFELYNLKNADGDRCYSKLCLFVFNIMSLPHSSAAAERVFSNLTNIKTKNRNRLLPDTCNNLLHGKELLDGHKCYEWTPSRSVLSRNVVYK